MFRHPHTEFGVVVTRLHVATSPSLSQAAAAARIHRHYRTQPIRSWS